MSETGRGKLVEMKGSKSDKEKLGRTRGKCLYHARAREPIGQERGLHSRLVRKRERERGRTGELVLMMEAVQTSETSVNSYQSTQRYNPEDGHLVQCRYRSAATGK
jgi:hypothetical protein